MAAQGKSAERYNPITGTGIPATPNRANTSAIFGGSPGAIEYMFIPPSASTRPSRPSSSEKRRSLSRESLRRSFPPVSENQQDSDECSSVSDISECGSEADQREKTRKNSNALPKVRKPLSRSTSSRLPVSVQKPCVMKRAHSFTRGTTNPSTRGRTNDPNIAHSESDLTNQAKTPDTSTSKIPRKVGSRSTGPQSSRIPLKQADVGSNKVLSDGISSSTGGIVKRAASGSQTSGVPVKTSVHKRTPDHSKEQYETKTSAVKTGTSSGIPVKSSGIKTQQHAGSSTIPQRKQERSKAKAENKLNEYGARNENLHKEDDVKIALQPGEPLLKREGTGDELRMNKSDVTKSKLPRRSSIPRSSSSKNVQQKMKDENLGVESTKSKRTVKSNESYQLDTKVVKMEQHSASKIPVNQRTETRALTRSTANANDSGYGDTDSASSREDAAVDTGNEFCLSRENSKSKIPVMSRRGRVAVKTSGGTPNDNEVKAPKVTKRKAEKPKQELLLTTHPNSQKSDDKNATSDSKSRFHPEERPANQKDINETGDYSVIVRPQQKAESEFVDTRRIKSTEHHDTEKKTENDNHEKYHDEFVPVVDGGKGTNIQEDLTSENPSRESPNKEQVVTTTVEQCESKALVVSTKRGNLVTRLDNNNKDDNTLMPPGHSDAPDITNVKHTPSSNTTYCPAKRDCVVPQERQESLLAGSNKESVVNKQHANTQDTGAETANTLRELQNGPATRYDQKTGTEITGSLKKPDDTLVQTKVEIHSKSQENVQTVGQDPTDKKSGDNEAALENTIDNTPVLKKHTENARSKKDGIRIIESKREKHIAVSKEEETQEDEIPVQSAFDKTLPEVTEGEMAKRSVNCFECRLEQNESEDKEALEMDEGGENASHSNVRRYPTFISPRKSLVFCKHHEKLRNERCEGDDLDKPLVPVSVPADCKSSEVDTRASAVVESKGIARTGGEGSAHEKSTYDKKVPGDKLNNNISRKDVGVPMASHSQKIARERKNKESLRDINLTDGTDSEPTVKNIGQRSTTGESAREKDATKTTVSKGCHSPLLALSRDKKFVSRENLAQPKNTEDMRSALSLEWDDVGTELSPPNFSDDDDSISESGSRRTSQVNEDNRRPSVKLMNTNEALDKLKVIQSLIMKEAESRSRKESEESAGRFTSGVTGPAGEVGSKKAANYGKPVNSTSERQQGSSGYEIDDRYRTSNEVSPTSDLPGRKASSPTIWDRISDSTISQDQTTELLNETLAKLKASPQLSSNAFARRTISSRSLPGSRQASKERLLSDAERPVYVYTSSWMNTSGKNSRGSSLSLCSANRSLPSSRQNLAKDPFHALLKRSESASGRMEKENGRRTESKEKFRLSNFDEMLSDDGHQDLKNQVNYPTVSPVSEKPIIHHVQPRKPIKRSKRTKKSKNSAEKMNNLPPHAVSMDELTGDKTKCQCGGKNCIIS